MYIDIDMDIYYKCKDALKELSGLRYNLEECLEYFNVCVNDGIVPIENLKENIQFLSFSISGICELLEMFRDYIGNIGQWEHKVEGVRKLKQIILILENRQYRFEDLRKVLTDSVAVVEYWCAQKWVYSEISTAIKSSVENVLKRECDPGKLIDFLMVSIREHLYRYYEFEKSISMTCVYAPPEKMGNKYFDEPDKSEEMTYPVLHAIDDDLEDPLIMQELYGGPDLPLNFVGSSDAGIADKKRDSGINDADETVQFCRKCGKIFAMKFTVCPFCGTIARE